MAALLLYFRRLASSGPPAEPPAETLGQWDFASADQSGLIVTVL